MLSREANYILSSVPTDPRKMSEITSQNNASSEWLRFPLVSKHKRELNEQEYW